jgi:hypothetical protein
MIFLMFLSIAGMQLADIKYKRIRGKLSMPK